MALNEELCICWITLIATSDFGMLARAVRRCQPSPFRGNIRLWSGQEEADGAGPVPSAAAAVTDDHGVAGGADSELPRHRKKVISRALEVYLNDVRAHNKMMAREQAEFELGKRHLANMMGLEPACITQHDVDRSFLLSCIFFS